MLQSLLSTLNSVMIRVVSLILLTTLTAAFANPIATPPELLGVWNGTIGNKKIMACWDERGGYYYPLQKITLAELSSYQQPAGKWIENMGSETIVSWQISEAKNGKLIGFRHQPDKQPEVIRLSRFYVGLETNKKSLDCVIGHDYLSKTFYAPRVNALKILYGKPKQFMKNDYRVVSAVGGKLKSIELTGGNVSLDAANQQLRKEFTERLFFSLSCKDTSPGKNGDFNQTQRLRFWNEEWLSWSTQEAGYCGGARPFFSSETRTINVATGKEINLWSWFKLVKKSESFLNEKPRQICEYSIDKPRCLPDNLSKLIFKLRPTHEDKYCEKLDFHSMADGASYSLGLNEKGIAFIPSLVEPARGMRTCYGHYTVAYVDLEPHLSDAGLATVDRIRASLIGKIN